MTETDDETKKEAEEHLETCPVCGSELIIHQGRCITCMECGWSICSM